MARVYLDEDVSVLVATLLKARNIAATTAREEQMLGKSDREHLERAIALKSVLVTHNRVDFEHLYRECIEKNVHQFGIVILVRRRDVYSSVQKLARFFAEHPSIENQLWYV